MPSIPNSTPNNCRKKSIKPTRFSKLVVLELGIRGVDPNCFLFSAHFLSGSALVYTVNKHFAYISSTEIWKTDNGIKIRRNRIPWFCLNSTATTHLCLRVWGKLWCVLEIRANLSSFCCPAQIWARRPSLTLIFDWRSSMRMAELSFLAGEWEEVVLYGKVGSSEKFFCYRSSKRIFDLSTVALGKCYPLLRHICKYRVVVLSFCSKWGSKGGSSRGLFGPKDNLTFFYIWQASYSFLSLVCK
uniref:Uncharacterized protein n=1 Tax=Cucumis melo TaxID=3656 RepID=A0A9I9EFY9_CUCME